MTVEAFDAAWLTLREPVDHRSRPETLVTELEREWRLRRWRTVLDLGSGTGSNLRYLAPKLSGRQVWTLFDQDADLLAAAATDTENVHVSCVRGDLVDLSVGGVDLVTASALLDLVSEGWLRGLVDACCGARCGVLFALTYDGTILWSGEDPEHPDPGVVDDSLVREAVNRHQQKDKGLGPALGPRAGSLAESLFRRAGYRTSLAASAWQLGPSDGELVRALIDGWEQAAVEVCADQEKRIRRWADVRRRAAETHGFMLTVGHVDLLALPDDTL